MDNVVWDDLRVLLAVHRTGSLLGAGKLLGLSTSTTGRRLDALEADLGSKLVHRTQAGSSLAPAALRLVQLAETFEHGLKAQQRDRQQVAGTIRVSVPDGMAMPIARVLFAFRLEHPGVDIELAGENRMTDIAKREADIALRLVRSTSSLLIEKHAATLKFALFASAGYAQRRLPERRLRRAEAVTQDFVGLDARWKGLPHERWMVSLGAARFSFRSSSIEAIVEAVRQGVGLSALPEQDAFSAGLVRISTESAAPTQPVFLVYHRDLRNATHVRAAVKLIASHLHGWR